MSVLLAVPEDASQYTYDASPDDWGPPHGSRCAHCRGDLASISRLEVSRHGADWPLVTRNACPKGHVEVVFWARAGGR